MTNQLTQHEIEVLQLAAFGLPPKEMARTLNISLEIVKHRIRRARKKLGTDNVPQAIAISVSRGYIKGERE